MRNLPPSVLITSPANGQVFTDLTGIPITAAAAAGSGTFTGVAFYYNSNNPAGTSPVQSVLHHLECAVQRRLRPDRGRHQQFRPDQHLRPRVHHD